MSGSIDRREHAARGSLARPMGSETIPEVEEGPCLGYRYHNGALAFGSRQVWPTKLQMRGNDLVI